MAVVNDYRQVRDDGSEFLGHGVFLVGRRRVSWWLFDSYACHRSRPPGAGANGELVLTKTTERGEAVHRFGLEGDDLTYAIDLTPDDREPEPFLRGAAIGPSAATESGVVEGADLRIARYAPGPARTRARSRLARISSTVSPGVWAEESNQ